MAQKITEEKFIDLYMASLGNKTFGNNAKSLYQKLVNEGFLEGA